MVLRYSLLRFVFVIYRLLYRNIFNNGDRTSLRQTLSYSSYLLIKTLGYNNKSETSRTWVKNSRFRDRNKCTKNETARLYVKAAEISRLDEKFARPTIFEVPFATPLVTRPLSLSVHAINNCEIREGEMTTRGFHNGAWRGLRTTSRCET